MSYSSDNSSLQNQLPLSVELSEDPKDMRYEINDLYQTIVSSLNNKIGGLYVPQEKLNSEQYFKINNTQTFRNVYRMVVDFGALPNTSSKSVLHNIPGWNNNFRLTSSFGAATDPQTLQALPIPNLGILVEINSTSVTITTITNRSNFTESTVVIEYTKEP